MSLIKLIDKYKINLAIPIGSDMQEDTDRYRAFASELVRLPSFTYTKEDMRTAITHMVDLGFSIHARYRVAAYAIRRAAMGGILDISDRGELFEIWDIACLDIGNQEKPRLRKVVKNFVRKIGRSKLEEYILKVQEGFKVESDEVDTFSELDEKTQNISENHRQLMGLQRYMLMRDVLEILREL